MCAPEARSRPPFLPVLQATQDKVQALVRLSEAERGHSRLSNQVDSLKKQNQDLTHRLTQATQEKVNALMQLAADGNGSGHAGGAPAGKAGVPSPVRTSTWKVQTSYVFANRHCDFGGFTLSEQAFDWLGVPVTSVSNGPSLCHCLCPSRGHSHGVSVCVLLEANVC